MVCEKKSIKKCKYFKSMLSWIIRSINLPKNLELQQSSLISEFDIKTASDIQTALKELLSKTI